MILRILEHAGSFAENKDIARRLRKEDLETALSEGQRVTLDFTGVGLATQSFIHALISDVIRQHSPRVLNKIRFKGCNASLKSLIRVVVQYSQEDTEEDEGA